MTDLIALLSTGKGTWSKVVQLMKSGEWNNIFLVTTKKGAEKFAKKENLHFVIIDARNNLETLKENMMEQLKDKVSGTQVGLNMISGTGKEHMALLSSLLSLGLGIRLVFADEKGIKEL